MKLDIHIRELCRRTLILLVGSAVVALLLIVMFTDSGTHALFRFGVFLDAEAVDVSDMAYLEYYDVKASLNDEDSYRIFLDETMQGSYDAALDFLKFIKQNTDVNAVCMAQMDAEAVNEYLKDGDMTLLTEAGITGSRRDFLQKLYLYNQILPPQKRVHATNFTDERCFIIENAAYDPMLSKDGVVDVSVNYPGMDGCDPLFDVQSLLFDGCRIRFGVTERLAGYTKLLETNSGNLGMPAFGGLKQPDYYFLIENGADGEGGILGKLIAAILPKEEE